MGACGVGRLRGPEGGRGRMLLSRGTWQPGGLFAMAAAVGLSVAKEVEGKMCHYSWVFFSESVFGSWEGAFISLLGDTGPAKNHKAEKK